MPTFVWTFNEDYNTWNISADGAHVSIAHRPHWCDRGRYVAVVTGVGDIDRADEFPRYFMNLERAKDEMAEWLGWRIRTREQPTAYHRWNARSMLVTELAILTEALRHHEMISSADESVLRALIDGLRTRVGIEGART